MSTIEDSLKGELRTLLLRCTKEQQNKFEKIYRGSRRLLITKIIDGLDYDKLLEAINLCKRTIKRNETEGNAL